MKGMSDRRNLVPFLSDLNTHLAQESEKLKEAITHKLKEFESCFCPTPKKMEEKQQPVKDTTVPNALHQTSL